MRANRILVAITLIFISAIAASAQLGGLGGLGDKLKKKTPNLLGDKMPITTSLPDAKWADASKDGFTPREPERSLMTLQRTPNGGFVLQPGYYSLMDQSYCLKAGTHGPGGGTGYLYAPPKGPAEDAVMTIVRNSVNHPEIHQHDIQVLLWAIIARARFEDLDSSLKATAARLLTPRQLAALNRSALDALSGKRSPVACAAHRAAHPEATLADPIHGRRALAVVVGPARHRSGRCEAFRARGQQEPGNP